MKNEQRNHFNERKNKICGSGSVICMNCVIFHLEETYENSLITFLIVVDKQQKTRLISSDLIKSVRVNVLCENNLMKKYL